MRLLYGEMPPPPPLLIETHLERVSLHTLNSLLGHQQASYDCGVCHKKIQMSRIYQHIFRYHFDFISTIVPCMICCKQFRLMERDTLARRCSMMAFITHTTLCILSLEPDTPAVVSTRRSYCAKMRTLARKLGFSMPVHRIYDYSLDKTRVDERGRQKWVDSDSD